ncbi:polysaccharide pyruvyl transferase family protein, partial [Kitasatospora sp. SC0581]|uniref:polysaccharide pyruvyl transferase family protein n=1 Tax=Kitasatospora sp. SC0581 TaxID=3394360 RepID=UPI003A842704
VESVPAVWDLSKDNSSIKRYIRGTKSFFTSFLSNKNNNQLSYYNMADTVISVGGGYLYSSRRGPLGIGLLNSLFHIYLAKKMKKTVICFPQSVGPLNYIIDKWIVKKVLKKVDLFMSREAITTKLLKSFGLKKVIEIPDIGFTLSPADIGKIHD